MANSAQYLQPQTLAAVESVELRARFAVEGLMSGMHRSPMRGISVEFAQHRPYVPGDEPRFIDWKVYAKTDKLYLKQFQKETNLDLVILVDVSGSMAYGGGESGQVAEWSSRQEGQADYGPRDSATWPFNRLAAIPAHTHLIWHFEKGGELRFRTDDTGTTATIQLPVAADVTSA